MTTSATTTLDQHVRDVVQWHFSPDTGCPFWLNWVKQAGWNPVEHIQGFDDLKRFDHFNDEWMRTVPLDDWVPKAYADKPYKIFETGGTTGMPKQRISWEDHLTDYTEFSEALDIEYPGAFPHGSNWLMMGPTGPRRLRLAIEHLANVRGGSCFHLDLDPRWVKKVLAEGDTRAASAYKDHVVAQAVEILKHRDVACLFTTPRLLEALGDRMDVVGRGGIKGVFCGGTSMTPQVIRFLVEEVLENKAALVPTYGNTLMGLARPDPVSADDNYALTYHAPQPRAVLRVVDPDNTDQTVEYDQWGRVELTTLTREFFMPRFLERDEALRRRPTKWFDWDGVGEVRPFGSGAKKGTIEGVY